jgi:hypothetical protein
VADGVRMSDGIQNRFNLAPQSAAERQVANATAAMIGSKVEAARSYLGDAVYDLTDSPAAAAFAYSAPESIMAASGLARGGNAGVTTGLRYLDSTDWMGNLSGPRLNPQFGGVLIDSGVVPAPFSRLSPGGGLQAHENAGGHLLDKHVGKTEFDLQSRLAAEPKISGSSSFYDRAAAEDAMSRTLDSNQTKVSNWLSGTAPRLRIDYTLTNPVGISVTRGAAGAVDASSARAILVRDSNMPTGYKILTGFPTLP